MNQFDANNVKFIEYTLVNENIGALKTWFDEQDPDTQHYVLGLIKIRAEEVIQLLAKPLVSNVFQLHSKG